MYRSPLPDVQIPVMPLTAFVFRDVERWADKPALIDGPSGRTLTYGQLAGAIEKVAGGLAARGFEKGDVFAIYSPNIPEYAIIFYAVIRLGGIVTTINPLYTVEELVYQLNDARAKALITIPLFLGNAQEAARESGVEDVYVFGEAAGALPFAALFQGGNGVPDVQIDVMEDVAVLPYSSGTTGLPKGVMLTHHNLVANVCQTLGAEHIDREEVLMGILPFYHIYGMVVIMSMVLSRGATIITMPRFDMEQFLEVLQNYKVSFAHLVPPIILGLAKYPGVDRYDLSALKTVFSGAAPLPAPVAKACAERLGCSVRQGYGLTETSPVTHLIPLGSEDKITTVGPAVPNTTFRVIDVEGEDAASGTPGEIWIRGPQVMKGYLNRPKATADMIDEDGWLHTGDVGVVDEEGFLSVIDRVKELIKYKGLQVAPAELESVLQSHPAVADVAVIPSPDEEAGEVPKAYVVLKPGMSATAQEIMDYVAAHVAPYKKVRKVEFIEAIPKVPSGKILRRKLVERERAGR